MIEKAMDERNSARLEKLIARVKAKLQKIDAASVRRLRCLRRLSGKLSPILLQERISKTAFKLIMPTRSCSEARYVTAALLVLFKIENKQAREIRIKTKMIL
jgi:hypothetical protein